MTEEQFWHSLPKQITALSRIYIQINNPGAETQQSKLAPGVVVGFIDQVL